MLKNSAQQISRRKFLGSGAAVGGFTFLPAHVLGRGGAVPPSDKANIAFIGIGNYGYRAIEELESQNTVAFCDVDWRELPHFKNSAIEVAKKYPQAKRFDDWRVLLDQVGGRIDSVVISTADHTHAAAAISAMKMGKHVFCEKPLAHNIHEVRAMMAAEKKYKVATQTGIQGHASEDCRMLVEWIRDRAIGTVKDVQLFQSAGPQRGNADAKPYAEIDHVADDIPVPPEVKWDLWVGPAPYRPFNPMYLPMRWRSWVDFGTGILGDHGPHFFDPVYWALDLGFPESIEAETDPDYDARVSAQVYPRMSLVHYKFPARGSRPAVPVTWHGFHTPEAPKGWPAGKPLPNGGGIITGTQGTIVFGPMYMSRPGEPLPGQVTLLPEELNKSYKRPEKTIPRPTSHWLEWVEAAKARKQPSADFEYGGMITQITLLGDIAIRHKGQLLYFDSKSQKFKNSDTANKMFETPYRAGWTLPS